MPEAAIYARTAATSQDGSSLTQQLGRLRDFCQQQGLNIRAEYADEGASGNQELARRPEGGRLLASAREQRFDVLVVVDLDRIARDPDILQTTLDRLSDLGVSVKTMESSR